MIIIFSSILQVLVHFVSIKEGVYVKNIVITTLLISAMDLDWDNTCQE